MFQTLRMTQVIVDVALMAMGVDGILLHTVSCQFQCNNCDIV